MCEEGKRMEESGEIKIKRRREERKQGGGMTGKEIPN